MATYTIDKTKGESFDAEILRQELVAAIGPDGWYINTAGDTVEFVGEFDPSAVIAAHFANGAKREHNAAIKKQIADLEATVTPRRLREAVRGSGKAWLDAIDDQIAVLRSKMQ